MSEDEIARLCTTLAWWSVPLFLLAFMGWGFVAMPTKRWRWARVAVAIIATAPFLGALLYISYAHVVHGVTCQ